ncbi:protein-methionine-sulfoxide reductase catalytic subunit MsrP [Microvirga sp. W0021]|uniref:Protein-methionine-sulfoxide reductase catalytic subunit MsrP n=1 Tax=Hohaiivirga grylli TaxID=3133970 RepID=A0ABV0BL04_9HYPH
MAHFKDHIPSSEITPKDIFLNRRSFMAAAGGTLAAASMGLSPKQLHAAQIDGTLPATRNKDFSVDVTPTAKNIISTYNNYYEFGTDKSSPSRYAERLVTRPWTVEVTGEVETPRIFDIDDLLKLPLQERVYRFRCVEAWSMVVPWIGFEFRELAKLVNPTSKAKYVEFTTVVQKENMTGLRYPIIDWPYKEGLRIDEAMHPLTLLTVGLYGDLLPNQNGAPIRLIVPWKYGFKGAKSIVRIAFVEKQPKTSWVEIQPQEYGFYANVNPAVSHPRWSQQYERALPNLFASQPTLPFNGYADQVASLYTGMDLSKYY